MLCHAVHRPCKVMSEIGGVGEAGPPPPPGEKQKGRKKSLRKSGKRDQSPGGTLVNTDGAVRGPSRKSSRVLRETKHNQDLSKALVLPERKQSKLGLHNGSGQSPFGGMQKKDSLGVMREESWELELASPHKHHCEKLAESSDLEDNTPRKLRSPIGLAAAAGNADMDSIDLDDVEVLRNDFPNSPHGSSLGSKKILSELEELGSDTVFDLCLDAKLNVGNGQTQPDLLDMVSIHPEIELNCGLCEDFDIRISGIESQIGALREVVKIAGSEGSTNEDVSEESEERSTSKKGGKWTWKDHVFGNAAANNPQSERQKLLLEREELHKAINFLFRKIEETESKRKKIHMSL